MKITRNEANSLYNFKRTLLEKGFSCELDKIKLASHCHEFYTDFLNISKPNVFIADGPSDAASILDHIQGRIFSKKHDNIIEFALHTEFCSIRKRIDFSVFNLAKSAKAALKEELGPELFQEVRNILFRDLNFQFSQSVHHVVERSITNLRSRKEKSSPEFAAHPSFADRDWLNFYRGCSEVFGIDSLVPESYSKFVQCGLFCGYFFEEFAVLVPVPSCMHKNENLVLHHDDEVAVSWIDGTDLAYWNGIEVPSKLICNPETITASEILNETNAEVRRCYQEKLGSEKFGNLLGLVSLDRKTDRFGNELVLYRTEKVDKLAGDFIYFAKVVCPSTGRKYFLCVPPGLSGVEEAVSWTFGKTPEDYRPSIET
ncbi:hypothetical protein O3Q51_15130 [Cryomorphaceae bacterium 1068]|nr:hypothetical protein [Cryomorphaceae bacterium 1068]